MPNIHFQCTCLSRTDLSEVACIATLIPPSHFPFKNHHFSHITKQWESSNLLAIYCSRLFWDVKISEVPKEEFKVLM